MSGWPAEIDLNNDGWYDADLRNFRCLTLDYPSRLR